MKTLGTFLAGFATGWVVRSGADSSRRVAVAALATAYEIADRARHWAAVEREHVEDLLAEARAEYQTRRDAVWTEPSGAADGSTVDDIDGVESEAPTARTRAPRTRRERAAREHAA